MKTLADYKQYLQYSSDEFYAYQLDKLKAFVNKIKTGSKYYQKVLAKHTEITGFDDFEKLPLLEQGILRESDPEELIAVPWENISYITRSSGSTGKSKVVLWTPDSLKEELKWGTLGFLLEELVQHSRLAVLMPFDMTRLTYTIDVCREMGAFIIPIGRIRDNIDVDNAIYFLRVAKATHLLGSPARLESIAARIIEMGLDPKKDFAVTHLLTGGAILTPHMRKSLGNVWGAKVFEQAGANELSFIGAECKYHNGLHLTPGLHYVEILDEDTHLPIKDGKSGEIVITQFTNLATPLLRYRLGDRGHLIKDKCPCGLSFPRLFIEGRIGGTITIGGTKIHAFQIENVLSQFSQISQFYQAQITGDNAHTLVKLVVEANVKADILTELSTDIVGRLNNDPMVVFEVNDKIKNGELEFEIEFVAPGSLERSGGDKVKNQYLEKRSI
ncbi:MAG: AMP-binding protein [bacterium]